jgi:hypothetical protein
MGYLNMTSEIAPWTEISDPAALIKAHMVSVLMCTYNHAAFINKGIEDVLQQETSFPIELVIGEYCSTG